MTTLVPTSPLPGGGARSRSGSDPIAGAGRRPDTADLLLGDVLASGGGGGPRPAHRRGVPLLEEALAIHLASLAPQPLEAERLQAVIDRLGVGGRPPLTLAEAGRMAGLSGERVRQLEARLRKQQREAPRPPAVPQLDAALAAVARAVPLPAAGVGRLLMDAGITAGTFSAESLRRAAELLGRRVPFVFAGVAPATVLLPSVAAGAAAHGPAIESRARRQAERCGATTIDELERELAHADGVAVSRRQLRVMLETSGSVVCLSDGWFAFCDARSSGAFVRASLRMLAVCHSLSLESMYDGLRRHNAFRRLPKPPPPSVLEEVYRHHPAFRFDDGMVSSVQVLDLSSIGPLNHAMVQILAATPGGVMQRAQLLDACHQAGLNLTSVNLYTTYSECLERIGPGLFAARGGAAAHPPPVAKRRSPQAENRPAHGFTPDGRPWLAGRVTSGTWANGVVHVPAELRSVLDGRHFPCHDQAGARVTTLGIDCHGNSWGWTGFLRRAGAQLGDVVRAVFDPAAGTAVLELVAAGTAPPAA